jgi:hypothetical protein
MRESIPADADAVGTRCIYCSVPICERQMVQSVGLRWDGSRWTRCFVHANGRACDFSRMAAMQVRRHYRPDKRAVEAA